MKIPAALITSDSDIVRAVALALSNGTQPADPDAQVLYDAVVCLYSPKVGFLKINVWDRPTWDTKYPVACYWYWRLSVKNWQDADDGPLVVGLLTLMESLLPDPEGLDTMDIL